LDGITALSHFEPADRVFAFAFIAIYTWLMLLRVFYRSRAGDLKRRLINREEGVGNVLFRWIVGLALIVAVVFYFAAPGQPPWAYVSVPPLIRFLGVLAATLGVAIIWWSHATLRETFSTTLRLREDHRLVTSGPYRYVVHPIYTGFLLLFLATTLFTRSWLIGVLGALVIGSLMTTRLRREERMMTGRFGADYTEYLARTGRFFPRPRRGFRRGERRPQD
jgi:protein-S-isoprenylcysteine O-methyltransferase Ste14